MAELRGSRNFCNPRCQPTRRARRRSPPWWRDACFPACFAARVETAARTPPWDAGALSPGVLRFVPPCRLT
eukprot:3800820-Prymnesium_polylepis.1